MARRRNREPVDDLLKDKESEFERGMDRKEDEDLDEFIWEQGDYENKEPLEEERTEFEGQPDPAEEELSDEVDEKGIRVREMAAVLEPEKILLRIEISGDEMEVVCGQIPASLKKRLDRECQIEKADIEDIWYDDDKMKRIAMGSWSAWYNVDEFYHEIGLIGKDTHKFMISAFLDEEPIEDMETDVIRTVIWDGSPNPRPRKDCLVIVAGTLNEGRFIYEQDVEADFDVSKLEFFFTDLRKYGIAEYLLSEIRYDGVPMYYEHEEFTIKDMLDVKIVKL
jgi:hypothetical protein